MINRQITIRPQDIVALIKILSFKKQGKSSWLKIELAAQLHLSKAEVTKIFERLKLTGLVDFNGNVVQPQALYEFLIYGLKYTFPAFVGHETRGILTGANTFPQSGIKGIDYVWEDYNGQTRGSAISPLYPEVISAVKDDDHLYRALAACDMLRVGLTREVNFARDWLKHFILD